MRRFSLISGALIGALAVAVLVAWWVFVRYLTAPGAESEQRQRVEVPKNASPAELTRLLSEAGLIRRPQWFQLYLEHLHAPVPLHEGEYELDALMTPTEIVDRLRRGSVLTYTVALSPGLRARDMVAPLAEAGLADLAALRGLLAEPGLAAELGVPSVEGFLFPDAYSLPRGLAPRALLEQLVARYRKTVGADILEDAKAANLTERELIILASLIEVDAVHPDEKTMLSGMYHNRLKRGLRLENPATVAYGLDKTIEALGRADLGADHAWNTYTHVGLPPTPIAGASLSSIVAAARPVKTDALYFAPRGDGTHVFCPDEECHKIAIERWRAELARRKAKAP